VILRRVGFLGFPISLNYFLLYVPVSIAFPISSLSSSVNDILHTQDLPESPEVRNSVKYVSRRENHKCIDDVLSGSPSPDCCLRRSATLLSCRAPLPTRRLYDSSTLDADRDSSLAASTLRKASGQLAPNIRSVVQVQNHSLANLSQPKRSFATRADRSSGI
jgi:hypothetical protein